MLTQCPNCDTTFRVTSEILELAQGQVRCGRCQTQFDALERLIEELSEEEDLQAAGDQDDEVLAQSSGDEQEYEIDDNDISATQDGIAPRNFSAADGNYKNLNERTRFAGSRWGPQPVEEWVAGSAEEDGAALDEPDTQEAEEFIEDAPADALADEPNVYTAVSRAPATLVPAPARTPAVRSERLKPREITDEFAFTETVTRRNPTVRTWKILIAPLLLSLVVQVVHHNRVNLARNPRLGPAVTSFYRAMRMEITDLRAYEVRQRGAISNPAERGTLKIRASIKNKAGFAQPYPRLKLVLEDRFGGQVRAREFEPAEYLDVAPGPDPLMQPQQEIEADIVIVDPGADAEGFNFDVCLPGKDRSVCAEDLPPLRYNSRS